MGITGLIPFLDKASRTANISEFNGCTAAIDSYCWLHKGAFACAEKLVRGEETDVYIRYCLKYLAMLLANNIKPIMVFDGRHLPAKAATEAKRRESRDTSRKRAAELLSLGKADEARSCMRRCVDITHAMALRLIKECRRRRIDCVVGPYEADAQLAYLNAKNVAQLVITEDSDLMLFGCTKVLFKMDLDGTGVLVEASRLPLVMKCPIEHYRFEKFLRMCILSGCDYLPSLPGIGLAKARQFINATQDSNIANALRKLPSYFNKAGLVVSDEYRENFLKAEATFKHQYVYDPIDRKMVRLTELEEYDIQELLCVNAGEELESRIAFQLALGNLDPFTLRRVDDWHPDKDMPDKNDGGKNVSNYPSIWSKEFKAYLKDSHPWRKKQITIVSDQTKRRKKVVNVVTKYVPETQDESLSIEALSKMYSAQPLKEIRQRESQENYSEINLSRHDTAMTNSEISDELTQPHRGFTSPILENKSRSFRKLIQNGNPGFLKRLSKFPRTVVDRSGIVESKFFSSEKNQADSGISEDHTTGNSETADLHASNISNECDPESPKSAVRNPFRKRLKTNPNSIPNDDSTIMKMSLDDSQKENSPVKSVSPVLECKSLVRSPNRDLITQHSYLEGSTPNCLGNPFVSELAYSRSQLKKEALPNLVFSSKLKTNSYKMSSCRVSGLKKSVPVPSNQPTLLSKFGFQKRPMLKK